MLRRVMVSAMAAGLMLSTAALPAGAQDEQGAFTLTVLHNNDGESALLPTDFAFTEDTDLVALACAEAAEVTGFDDVTDTNVHREAIACAADRDIIEGTTSSTFSPDQDLARGQIASLLERMLLEAGEDLPPADEGQEFSDLDDTHGDAVRRLAAADIVRGYANGSFGTYDDIARDELAALMVRSLEYVLGEDVTPENGPTFGDVDADNTHADDIAAAAELGLLEGEDEDTFAPKDATDRDQAASAVARLLGRVIGETATEQAGGVARFVDQVKEFQDEATEGDDAGVVTLSSGDNFLAGPQYAVSTASYEDGGPFYDALVYQEAGYDAITIGNHEFDFGPDGLADFVEATTGIPFLSANLDFSDNQRLAELVDAGRIADSTVVSEAGRDIGIIGATTEELASVTSPGEVTAGDVEAAVREEIETLQDDGVEHIILSSHLQDLDNEAEVVGELSGIDAVVGGGGAEDLGDDYPRIVTDADGDEVPVVTTPGGYRDVGKLVLEFDAAGELADIGEGSELRAVAPFGPKDPDTVERVEEPVQAGVADLAEEVVAETEVPLDGRTSVVRTRETNLGDLLADGMLETAQARAEEFGVEEADVALQNGGGIRGDAIVPPGDITALDTFTIAPFGNTLGVDTVTAEELVELIEHGLAGLPDAAGQFGQWAGVEFTYDVDGQAQEVEDGEVVTEGERVVDAVLTRANGDEQQLVTDGEVDASLDDVTIAALGFTINCGDAYPFPGCEQDPSAVEFTTLGITDQQVFQQKLEELGTVTAADYPDLTVDADDYRRYGPEGEFSID